MDVNLEKLKARAGDIRRAVAKIETYTALPDSEFWQDDRNLYAVKYLLLQAMEAVGSICVHVLAKKFGIHISNYAACFERLGENGVIPLQLAARLRKMIRFRNILIHRYWECFQNTQR